MKIAMITESLGNTGGIDTYVLEVSKFYPNEIDIVTREVKGELKIKNDLIFFKNYRDLKEIFKNYDILHVHYFPTNIYAALIRKKERKIKLVHTWHGIVPISLMSSPKSLIKTSLVYLSHSFTFRYCDLIISISNAMKKELGKFEKKAIVIPNGVDTKRFKFRRETGNKIYYFGALETYRGVCFIPKFAKQFSETPFILVGRGKLKKWIEKIIIKEKIKNLHILDYIPFDKMPRLYKDVLFTIRPSIYEGFGIPVLESLASGKPVITSTCPVFKEIVTHGVDGFISSFENFPKYIQLLLENKKLKKKMGKNGRKNAKKFDWRIISQNIFENIYYKL